MNANLCRSFVLTVCAFAIGATNSKGAHGLA